MSATAPRTFVVGKVQAQQWAMKDYLAPAAEVRALAGVVLANLLPGGGSGRPTRRP